ncbi:hypothetical protein PM082_007446 [Marasmius tenuissimus]|nr:hypothetical protein PM082_007446 [Marasmius tenuissimus]
MHNPGFFSPVDNSYHSDHYTLLLNLPLSELLGRGRTVQVLLEVVIPGGPFLRCGRRSKYGLIRAIASSSPKPLLHHVQVLMLDTVSILRLLSTRLDNMWTLDRESRQYQRRRATFASFFVVYTSPAYRFRPLLPPRSVMILGVYQVRNLGSISTLPLPFPNPVPFSTPPGVWNVLPAHTPPPIREYELFWCPIANVTHSTVYRGSVTYTSQRFIERSRQTGRMLGRGIATRGSICGRRRVSIGCAS